MDHDDSAAVGTLRDSATVHAVRREMARRAGPLLERLSRDPLGDPQTAAELQEYAQLMASERVAQGRAARTRLGAMVAGGDLP
ncbi:hypothetical protein [Cellulomonas marina]|uniref:Uncharacterized protein n=1 Tax=Cellulomonas marina TaxID=988821 RepID=A0A1I1AQM9_9CELL|nr:hypothetical protein [Cellulomonas marina]GIG29286.1 hypothetical protein Cma02nite_18860 [Cellulomonas marina]SFB40227.1 hypothetical protein SAMN05421867_12137 [Cellulomonas marina]